MNLVKKITYFLFAVTPVLFWILIMIFVHYTISYKKTSLIGYCVFLIIMNILFTFYCVDKVSQYKAEMLRSAIYETIS